MKIELNPPKFRRGEKVYLPHQGGSVMVTILDCYKINGEWFYGIDASNYYNGLELENVSESMLSRKVNGDKSTKRLSRNELDELVEEYKSIY